jgi:hypothetical protein
MLRIGLGDGCPYCGNLAVYRSHPETLLDRACWLLLLEVARCPGCMRQHYRPLLFAAPEYPARSAEEIHTAPESGNQTDPPSDEAA